MKVKVLVVDDTIFYRKILCDVLAGFPFVEVVGTANNGEIALSRIRTLKPDILTLDVEMPNKNGLQVLSAIQAEGLAVDCLMVSSKTVTGSAITMQALELGAIDCIAKPDDADAEANKRVLAVQLGSFLASYQRQLEFREKSGKKGPIARIAQPAAKVEVEVRPESRMGQRPERSQVIAIGISTGGPNALARFLPQLPVDIGVPILLVQHMPPVFTQSLAKSLDGKCALTVKEAVDGEAVQRNTVYIAPGGKQMKVGSGVAMAKIIRITDDPPENNCRPAVDYLFRSVAREYGSKTTCVVMTGMGSDGKLGCMVCKAGGAVVLAQHEASCVVYGMPKAVVDAGLADVVAPLDKLAAEIMKTV
ncbi:MAG: protein-glutamate methylesterase/protein-glutamine glutaminase [Thermodesulfobacteriota bacterium]